MLSDPACWQNLIRTRARKQPLKSHFLNKQLTIMRPWKTQQQTLPLLCTTNTPTTHTTTMAQAVVGPGKFCV